MSDFAFDSPVGTIEERRLPEVWPGHWVDATGYAVKYPSSMKRADWHTGADLNLNIPVYDSDAHALCYAASDGSVKIAAVFPVWGTIVVIQHDDIPEVGRVFTRYAHLETILVLPGQVVLRGQPLGRIGNASGRYAYHLHYDIARVDLSRFPTDWPNTEIRRLKATYFDPRAFTLAHRGIELESNAIDQRVVIAEPKMFVRASNNKGAIIMGSLPTGTVVTILDEIVGWGRIAQPVSGWIELKWTRLAAGG